MKGITPIIAIILLLLITISLVGFMFIWITKFTENTGAMVENRSQTQLEIQGQQVSIDNVGGKLLSLRNVGTASFSVNKIAVYINSTQQATCGGSGWSPTTLNPGDTAQCTDLSPECAVGSGSTIKVTAPGGSDFATC